MQRAKTLPQVIQNFNPILPLKAETLKAWYVDRPRNQMGKMKTYLQGMALNGMPVKILFTGHVGSGKSTELNKLAEALKKRFFIVSFEARTSLNIADMRHTDLLLGMAMALFARATEPQALGKAPGQVVTDYLAGLKGFITETVFGPANFSTTPQKTEISAEINALALKFQAKFAAEASTRAEI
jgi:predicted KAP-like P-loop ATPase